jgi:TatD DNase family protein
MYVDIHTHLFHDAFNDDRTQTIRRAQAKNVTCVNNGLDHDTNEASRRLAQEHDVCRAAAGLYPRDAQTATKDERQAVYEQMRDDAFIAIGEIGLDYGYADTAEHRRRQRQAFKAALRVSQDEHKPVIIHSRNAENDVLDILDDTPPHAAVLHSFTGRKQLWRRAIRSGHTLSIPCSIQRSTHFQAIVDDAPLHQVLTESDAPYLGRHADERSEPAHITDTVDHVNQINGTADAKHHIADTFVRIT